MLIDAPFRRQGAGCTRDMTWDQAAEYLAAKADQAEFRDPEGGRNKGLNQLADEKTYRPGLEPHRRDA